jgi:hypothetical protein
VATHILARARCEADGHFGLRVTPSGIATPAFGAEGDVLRIAGPALVRESREAGEARSATIELPGRSLGALAAFAGVSLEAPFSVGGDTPDLGDPEVPIDIDVGAAMAVMAWLGVGAVALDRVLPRTAAPSVIQLWPEHFDISVDVATGHGRANLGASPGDGFSADPYLYVSPWEGARPGDPTFWNAPFGAVVLQEDGAATAEQVEGAVAFFETGLSLLGEAEASPPELPAPG